jgi:DNA-binding transcriptional MocR family regulator
MMAAMEDSNPRRVPGIKKYQQIINDVLHYIDIGRYKPGDQLPTEDETIAEYDVSRTTVQRARRSLVACGVIEIRHPYGAYVVNQTPTAVEIIWPGEVLRIRMPRSDEAHDLGLMAEGEPIVLVHQSDGETRKRGTISTSFRVQES